MPNTHRHILTVLLVACASAAAPLDGDFLSLGLGGGQHAAPAPAPSFELAKIMADDVAGEFEATEQAIGNVKGALETFARAEGIEAGGAAQQPLVSAWYAAHSHGQPPANEMVARAMTELDAMYATLFNQFVPLVQRIITERPQVPAGQQLGAAQLAYRCERYDELKTLVALANSSPLYRTLFDTFASELYVHCLKRKLALVAITGAKPSAVVRQFVEIYLELPMDHAARVKAAAASKQEQPLEQSALDMLQAGQAARFEPQAAIARHGRLEQTAAQVLDLSSSLSLGDGSNALVAKFKNDCAQNAQQLAQIWSTFDEFATFLSSPMNDLAAYNSQIKLVAPQLVYAAVCVRLASAA